MPNSNTSKLTIDWLTTIAIAAFVYSLMIFLHEGTHALTCPIVGQPIKEFGALYVDCGEGASQPLKIVAASAPLMNLILGFLALGLLRRSANRAPEWRWLIWLFMLMNFLTGAGYFMFSGIANIGDLAVVITGWEPAWLWRTSMALIGSIAFMGVVWLALKELGRMIGGREPELYQRAVKLGLTSYATAIAVVILTGLFNPHGFMSLPVTAGLAAALGAMSPLIWMMFWFRAPMFSKLPGEPLTISRRWGLIAGAFIWVTIYIVILGRTIYF